MPRCVYPRYTHTHHPPPSLHGRDSYQAIPPPNNPPTPPRPGRIRAILCAGACAIWQLINNVLPAAFTDDWMHLSVEVGEDYVPSPEKIQRNPLGRVMEFIGKWCREHILKNKYFLMDQIPRDFPAKFFQEVRYIQNVRIEMLMGTWQPWTSRLRPNISARQ